MCSRGVPYQDTTLCNSLSIIFKQDKKLAHVCNFVHSLAQRQINKIYLANSLRFCYMFQFKTVIFKPSVPEKTATIQPRGIHPKYDSACITMRN